MDPAPAPSSLPEIVSFALAIAPAVLAALFGAANWSLAQLPGTRRAALRDSLEGAPRRAVERYIQARDVIEARWLVIRAVGVALAAVLIGRALPPSLDGWIPPLAALVAVVAYAMPAEMLKAIATQAPERWAPWFLRALRPMELAAAPLAAAPLWFSRIIRRRLERNRTEPPPAVTENEMELIVTEGEMTGALDHEQSEIIRNVLEFGDVTARDVMVPRTQTVSFELGVPIEQILKQVAETAHSRYPVHRETVDNVVGVLHTKDLLHAVARGDTSPDLESMLRPVAFVPESQSAATVLKDMRAGRHHLAIVIDEFGGFSGIVTLEDLLEQIVGDIRDEHDVEEAPIVDLGDGRLIIDASLPLADLSRYLGMELPSDGDYHSLGGFLTAHFGRVPQIGESLSELGLKFAVREADERHIAKVELQRESPPLSIAPRTPGRISAA